MGLEENNAQNTRKCAADVLSDSVLDTPITVKSIYNVRRGRRRARCFNYQRQ